MEIQEPQPIPRKRRSNRKPTKPEAPRTSKKVEHPPTEKPELVVEEPVPNKYAPKERIGAPTIGRTPNFVKSVGLGKLQVETVNGYTDV